MFLWERCQQHDLASWRFREMLKYIDDLDTPMVSRSKVIYLVEASDLYLSLLKARTSR